jgi:hypothetical protein
MKHKTSKRSISNKNHQQPQHLSYNTQTRRFSTSLTPIIDTSRISPNKIDLGIGTVHLHSHIPCLRANLTLKSQKLLKRDLLRCSDQRPSLLGSHTLQPPRMHHGSQQMHTLASPSMSLPLNQHQPTRRHSLSVNSRTFYATIDRIGPWPDISISRLRSDGNELLRPLKSFRNLKNPRVFSPKYYAALSENTSKFKFHSTTRTYIDEYRKQKGYLLGARTISQGAPSHSLLSSLPIQQSDDEQPSVVGTFSVGIAEMNNDTAKDRTILSTTDLSLPQNNQTKSTNDLSEYMNTSPSIPSVTKIFNEPHHINNFPTIPMRNGHLRPTRHPPHHSIVAQQTQHQQAITLPSLTASSLHYISSMTSVEKAYSNNKKSSPQNQSKLIFIDGRQRKRYIYIYFLEKYKIFSSIKLGFHIVLIVTARYATKR